MHRQFWLPISGAARDPLPGPGSYGHFAPLQFPSPVFLVAGKLSLSPSPERSGASLFSSKYGECSCWVLSDYSRPLSPPSSQRFHHGPRGESRNLALSHMTHPLNFFPLLGTFRSPRFPFDFARSKHISSCSVVEINLQLLWVFPGEDDSGAGNSLGHRSEACLVRLSLNRLAMLFRSPLSKEAFPVGDSASL